MVPIDNLAGRLGNRMFQFAYIFAQMKRGAIPDTWVQWPELFHEYEREIQELFGEGITPRPEVSVHVRRTDYMRDPLFNHLFKTDYYERALAMFPGKNFLVFSDDVPWCKRRWNDVRFTFVEGQTDIQDLNMMAGCAHNIIANSSFSWWAAYLNRNPHKCVVYPTLWHSDGVKRIGFPSSWTGI